MLTDKNFVVIGGGTGTYSVLSGLKKYTNNITAIVTMADSGGSAKKERDEWGLLPSSDIRKSLLALADVSAEDSLLLRRLFQYRYSEGKGVTGMTFGNLFLVALTKLLKSQKKAIEKAGKILKIKGRVLPVSLDKIDLVAKYEDGSTVVGEHFIDEPGDGEKPGIVKLTTRPEAYTTQEVKEAIQKSDVIIIGPGGFYTTVIANLVIKGVREAIIKSRAVKIYIMNLMTELGQTYGFTADKYIAKLNDYLPVNTLDFVFINNAPIPQKILNLYQKAQTLPVINDLPKNLPFKVIYSDFILKEIVKREKGDRLKRSLIRHDPDKIAYWCLKVLKLN